MNIYVPRKNDVTVYMRMEKSTNQLRLYEFRGCIYADMTVDGDEVLRGWRVMTNKWILPSYMEKNVGNLRFETYKPDYQEYVDYKQYNTKFKLVTYTEDELLLLA